jgi:flagellin-like protein
MQIKQTLKEFVSGNDRAVSPVIGVILMVAITVILAAVIGTFVLGLGDSVQQNVQAGATVEYDSSNDRVTTTFNSNQNADKVYVNVSRGSDTTSYLMTDVGDTVILDNTGTTFQGAELANSGTQTDDFSSTNTPIADGETITVTVNAYRGETSTVVVQKTDSI